MSEFHVPVVKLGEITKHPNADSLGITKVFAYPCIVRLADFQPGDLVIYVPVDAVVSTTEPRFEFLNSNQHTKNGKHRVRAMRLRGTFSMGLLVKADADMPEGSDVTERLGITKYEPPEPMSTGGEDEKDPGFLPIYTDIEGLRRWPDVLQAGEEVVLTEKLHGGNGRFLWREGRLWVGSHKNIKKETPDSPVIWWRVATQYKLAEKLAQAENIAFYGEVYGSVQNLHYGITHAGQLFLAFFDARDTTTNRYLDYDEFVALCQKLDLPMVPVLHRGPWSEALASHAEGGSTVPFAGHIREGFVVRPTKERWDERVQRVILKLLGESYLLRKDG